MWVLGVNAPPAGWHDAAACLVDAHGRVVAFSEEERLSRRRHSLFRGPKQAVRFCLESAGISPGDVDVVAVGWDGAWMEAGRAHDSREALHAAIGWERSTQAGAEVVNVPHHRAHATCAFHASGYGRAGVLIVDGNGEREATSVWSFEHGREPRLLRWWPTAHSIGYAYDAASRWLGFSLLDAGKTMGLAAYGRAEGLDAPALVDLDDGDYRLLVTDPEGAQPENGRELAQQYKRIVRAWERRFAEIAEAGSPAAPAAELHLNPAAVKVAHCAQAMVEQTVGWLAEATRALAGVPELCLAGGVALNCSTNGQLAAPIYVPPVPHDAGVALGAAWSVSPPRERLQLSPYLGSDPGLVTEEVGIDGLARREWDAELVAGLLVAGQVGALVEGGAEIGPRALCHRSLIALPRPADVGGRLNRLKHREPWRPFGPVALESSASGLWAGQGTLHDYMLGAAPVTEAGRAAAPAVVHVDATTRPQRVRDRDRTRIADLLRELERGGVPGVLVNTSFNDRGEPIVNSADDALRAFQAMDLDFLALEDEVLIRES